jgi:hypothetical protein
MVITLSVGVTAGAIAMGGASALAASSIAGITGAAAGIITALALLATSIGVLIPQLRTIRRQNAEALDKIDVVHDLVNSTLTSSIQSDLDATQTALSKMLELVAMQQTHGFEPAPETIAAIAAARIKIGKLTQLTADRLVTAEKVLDKEGSRNPKT